ncbi:MAG: DUF4124 domain-containing protein, partial [Gammaproteobacteria bacterium]|nr:DUF4124 domain-containing protein [Gammaproteobacteria bacterium]
STLKAGLALLAVAAAAVAVSGTVTYKWTDADGVHYSDQPHPGADKIILGTPPTYSSGQPDGQGGTGRPGNVPTRARAADAPFRYDRCAVVQPAEDQVLIDVQSVTIAVQAWPSRRSGDRVEVSLDGQAIKAASPEQEEFQVSPIDRGTHTVAATIRDADGKSLCQSPAISFHVRQPSVLAPQNPNNPNRRH